ncbi:D-lactate dehydrogenase [Lachnospiraceae bacterium KM106-2]|nr:D-lactate dehydrogenase [Lachnospiraceae bacterium KM106-2]
MKGMKKISFYDAKPYDKFFFDQLNEDHKFEIVYHDSKLSQDTAILSKGCDAVCAFVNDKLDEKTLEILYENGIKIIAMRCAGYNNIDFKYAYEKIHVVRVPAYSPYAVAEFAMGMLLVLNRKLHRAYNRTRDFNFSLNNLTGFDLKGKTLGIVGTGKIGRTFMEVASGFGFTMIAYDPYPAKESNIEYVSFEELCKRSDIISLHCPLTQDSYHLIDKDSLNLMKDGVFIINTSRGALINSEDLLDGIRSGKVGAAGLDVYEEESEIFFTDFSDSIIKDDILALLLAMPNVLITSHQAFLTKEALTNIAETTLNNLEDYFEGRDLTNEVCYHCSKEFVNCQRKLKKPCF